MIEMGFAMKRWFLRTLLIAVISLATTVGAASPSSATSGWKWASNADYGYMGENIIGSGLRVDDLLAKFIPPNRDFFTGHAWRFRISSYVCDPRGVDRSSAGCPEDNHWVGKTRVGNPPKGGTVCQSIGLDGTGVSMCQDIGLAAAYASSGDFPNFSVPRNFSSSRWLCTEIQKNTKADASGTWNNIGPGDGQIGKGLRACAQVHS